MKRFYVIYILAMCSLFTFAQELRRNVQIDFGYLLAQDSLYIYMEYPEYVPLSNEEISALKKQGFEPSQQVRFDVIRTLSRGRTIADVSFIPVIKKEGRWLKINSYDLKYKIVSYPTSVAVRKALRIASKVQAISRYAEHSILAQGTWVKIRVKNEGLYQISDDALKKMGFSDPLRVKLYGYGGRLLPDVFTFSGDDALIDDLCEVPLYRRAGSVLFYAEGLTEWANNGKFLTNTFSSYSYYFLTEGDSPSSFEQLEEPTSQLSSVDEVYAYALYDNDAYVWYGGGRDFYDNHDTQGGYTYSLSLPGNAEEKSTVYYDLSSQNTMGAPTFTISQQSTSSIVASGTISKTSSESEEAKGFRGSFTTTLGESEQFTVSTSSAGHLNYLYCPFKQHLSTSYTTSAFTTSMKGGISLHVASADANTRVWQLGTASRAVAELPGFLQGTTYVANAMDGSQRFVLVDLSKTYDTPEVVGNIDNQDLHADAAIDYVIIVPASGKLTSQAEILAQAHREKSGLRVKVVRADQLFNEFSSGTPDAAAYRRYLKMLYDKASSEDDMPRYLLLFGDCAYDNRMLTSDWQGMSPDDYLLAYERNDQENYKNNSYSVGTMHSYVTDDYYALLDDGEGADFSGSSVTEKIDLGVGRFLCHTEADAKWLVDQAISYLNNAQTGSWKNRMWVIGDVGDENLHMNDAQSVASQVASVTSSDIMLRCLFPDIYQITSSAKGATYPEATQRLKTLMQQGALIFNYNGHGSPDRLSHQFLLSKEDMQENVSTSRPMWIFASCEITPYDQNISDLGRNALFNEKGPAIGILCAARSVYSNYNCAIDRGFIKYGFAKSDQGKRYTMGDALRLAKCELVTNSGNTIGTDMTINKLKYVLLGDPALTLSYADSGIVIDSINGQLLGADSFSQLPVGGKVHFSGYIKDSTSEQSPNESFNGTLTATVYAPQQSLTCKGYNNDRADPLTYTDYTKTVYEGTVEVINGRFSIDFIVPRGITLSTDKALLSMYAVDANTLQEFNGKYNDFCFNGTAKTTETDTIGPNIYLYLNTPDFPDGGIVGTDAIFYASVNDSSAISMVSGNLGHDMELCIDGDASNIKVMNDYFSFVYGSYNEGLVEYPLSSLLPGRHTLTFRAWDVFDNSSTSSLAFVVRDGEQPDFDVNVTQTSSQTKRFVTSYVNNSEVDANVTTEVYNIAGMRIWHGTSKIPAGGNYAAVDWPATDYAGRHLPLGVYLYRSVVGNIKTKAKKVVITQ